MKKIQAILASLVIVFSLVGCDEVPEENVNEQPAQVEEPDPTPLYLKAVMDYFPRATQSCWGTDGDKGQTAILLVQFPEYGTGDEPTGWNSVGEWYMRYLDNGSILFWVSDTGLKYDHVVPNINGLICKNRNQL